MIEKAKRGDLIAVERTRTDYYANGPSQKRTTIELGIVTSITREGKVKRARLVGDTFETDLVRARYDRWYLLPQTDVDVNGALEAAAQHVWPGHNHPKPFDTLEEVRDLVHPYRTTVAA